jgi:hypothetical protein
MYRCHGSRYGVCRGPRCLEKIQTDFPCFEIDVGVADGRYEADRGRREGVCVRDVNIEEPATTCAVLVFDVRSR